VQFFVEVFHILVLFQVLHLQHALGSHIEDLNLSILSKGDQTNAQVLENGAEILVVGLLFRLVFLELGQNGIEFNVQVIGFSSVKFDRIELAGLVLLDVVEEKATIFLGARGVVYPKNQLNPRYNQK
jgi:hypothetical protein